MSDPQYLADLKPDPRNARRRTPRNLGTIVDALHEVGAARSIVIDEQGVILAGNATVEAAGEAGIERVRVIDADGEEIIAVRRTGLTAAQKQKLALYDNRAAELAEWQPDVLAGMIEELEAAGESLSYQAWRDDEREALADLMATALGHESDPAPTLDSAPVGVPEQYLILVECRGEAHQAELLGRWMDEGLSCRALTS